LVRSYISILKDLRGKVGSSDALLRDPILRGAVERYLHLAVEALIDVGLRICSILRLGRPERHRDIAKMLERIGVLNSEDARRFELWIGLRNILVHAYTKIDYGKLFEALEEVNELDVIRGDIGRFIEEKSIDPEPHRVDDVLSKVRGVLEAKSNILFAYAFGSRVRGDYTLRSDVDVAVYTEGRITWRNLVELMNELEDATGMRVDLVHLNTAPSLLAYEIATTGITIIDRDPIKRVDYEVKAIKEFLDLKPRLKELYETLLKTHQSPR